MRAAALPPARVRRVGPFASYVRVNEFFLRERTRKYRDAHHVTGDVSSSSPALRSESLRLLPRSLAMASLLVAPQPSEQWDNLRWVESLDQNSPSYGHALESLRAILVHRLERGLASRGVARDVCEDFAQEAVVRVQARRSSFRGESRFVSWATAIALRLAFDELRRQRWKDVSLDEMTVGATTALALVAPNNQHLTLEREQLLASLRDVIDHQLTPRQKAVLVAELNGVPHSELAVRLSLNRNALYKLAHDARKRVRAHLEQQGFTRAVAMSSMD